MHWKCCASHDRGQAWPMAYWPRHTCLSLSLSLHTKPGGHPVHVENMHTHTPTYAHVLDAHTHNAHARTYSCTFLYSVICSISLCFLSCFLERVFFTGSTDLAILSEIWFGLGFWPVLRLGCWLLSASNFPS